MAPIYCIAHGTPITGTPSRDGFGGCQACHLRQSMARHADPMVTHGPRTKSGQRERTALANHLLGSLRTTAVELHFGMSYHTARETWPWAVADFERRVG